MKSLDLYKDAVMKRAEDKRRKQRRNRRLLLTVCVPLCVCIAVAVNVFPSLLDVGMDFTNEGMPLHESALPFESATVYCGTTGQRISDTPTLQTLYGTLLRLSDLPATDGSDVTDEVEEPESTDVTVAGSSGQENGELLFEYGSNLGSSTGTTSGWRISFQFDDNNIEFTLQQNVLTDLSSGKTQTLSATQLADLTALLESITNIS